MKHPYVPRGCDQQGRMPDRTEAPPPAEASTDLGVEEPKHSMGWTVLVDVVLAAVFLCALAVVLWRLLA